MGEVGQLKVNFLFIISPMPPSPHHPPLVTVSNLLRMLDGSLWALGSRVDLSGDRHSSPWSAGRRDGISSTINLLRTSPLTGMDYHGQPGGGGGGTLGGQVLGAIGRRRLLAVRIASLPPPFHFPWDAGPVFDWGVVALGVWPCRTVW